MGWESAQFSAGKRRVFVRSEYDCGSGLTRSSNGVLAITGGGEFLDVQGINSGGNKGVRALRYRQLSEVGAVPAEIAQALQGRATAVSASRVSIAASLTIADIVEASHRLDAGVVEAWLVEFNLGAEIKPGGLNAKRLVDLADEGVPPSTIDVIVALAYPNVFAVNPATHESGLRAVESGPRTVGMSRGIASWPIVGYDAYGYPVYGPDYMMQYGCSSYGYSSYYYSNFGCTPYCLGYYGLSSLGCSRYAYGPYGYGYGYGAGYGWYPGSQPVVVVVRGPQPGDATPAHGRVVSGRGYSQGGSSTTSTPRSGTTSGTGSSGASTSTSGSSGSSSGRTAVPKKP